MKLFVWEEFSPDWTDGLAFAIADDLDQAMEMVAEDQCFSKNATNWGPVTILPLDEPCAFSVCGGG